MDNEVISYAQNREDLILSGFFEPKEKGFYVDIGAHDPNADSVTKYFYERGWLGINIEPLKQYYELLLKHRKRDINLNIGIGEKPGTLTLREYTAGTGLSTFSNDMKATYQQDNNLFTENYIDHDVEVKTLTHIFREQKVPQINFMKVDVEGYEYEVLASNDWKTYRPEVLCIEANHVAKDWQALLKRNKYSFAFFDGLNEYYVDNNKPDRLAKFSYVDAVVFREPIVGYRLLPKLQDYSRLKERVGQLEEEVELKNKNVIHLEGIISEIIPLRRHARRQLKLRLRGVDSRIIAKLGAKQAYQPAPVTAGDDILAADQANFKKYNRANHRTLALRTYLAGRGVAINIVSRLLGFRRI